MVRFEAVPQTIVMVVEGAAYGGGLGLMCGGDVVLAAADAKFSISETTLGVPPAQIAPFVAQRIGVARTRRLSLTAHRFDGREAERLGLVDMACDGAAALDAALAQVLAGISRCSPHANAVTKKLLLASRTLAREELLEQSADAFAECLRGAEGQEGVHAFLQKRKPKWMAQ
jgi:isohexenylglutaconyl-CoA hydratase